MFNSRKDAVRADQYGEDVDVDENLQAVLPPGAKVRAVRPSGASLWVQTVQIEVDLPDGERVLYFKKGAEGDDGRKMLEGCFEAESAMHAVVPEYVPRPIAWGTYKSNPKIHFLLCEFVEMLHGRPEPRKWAETVSLLHLKSAGKSPGGKFGFHIDTHLANVPVDNSWNDSWEQFWAQQMKSLLDREEKLRGRNEELSKLKEAFFEKVIPRLLRPLESGGWKVRPCLIHSDLWPGNIQHRAEEEKLAMFDSCPFWGHNEADLGICRNPRYRLGPDCVEAYGRFVPEFPSHPAEDFRDRNALYAMKFHALLSVLHVDPQNRKRLIDEMRELVDKFPGGYAAYEEQPVHMVESPTVFATKSKIQSHNKAVPKKKGNEKVSVMKPMIQKTSQQYDMRDLTRVISLASYALLGISGTLMLRSLFIKWRSGDLFARFLGLSHFLRSQILG